MKKQLLFVAFSFWSLATVFAQDKSALQSQITRLEQALEESKTASRTTNNQVKEQLATSYRAYQAQLEQELKQTKSDQDRIELQAKLKQLAQKIENLNAK